MLSLQLYYHVLSLRPKQWIKNVIIFIPLIFSGSLFSFSLVVYAIIAFLSFSFIAGAMYTVNDCVDKKRDLLHPQKQLRPVAANKISIENALFFAVILMFITLMGMFYFFPLSVILLFVSYIANTSIYIFLGKYVIFFDVILIALGFVFRALIGIYAIGVQFSWWFISVVFLGALLLAFLKRYGEMKLGIPSVFKFGKYGERFLKFISLFLGSLLAVLYIVYTQTSIQSTIFILTSPCIIFGIGRFLYTFFYKQKYSQSFEDIILKDIWLMLDIGLYFGGVIFLKYFQ